MDEERFGIQGSPFGGKPVFKEREKI